MGACFITSKTHDNKSVASVPPDVDLDQTMRGTWFGTKVRVKATIDASLYREIQKIIEREQKLAQERDWPEVPINNVVEMILRKGVRAYNVGRSTEYRRQHMTPLSRKPLS